MKIIILKHNLVLYTVLTLKMKLCVNSKIINDVVFYSPRDEYLGVHAVI